MKYPNNKEIVRKYIERIVNTGRTENLSKFIASNYSEIYEGKKYELGIQGAIEHIQGVRKTYPDLHLDIEQQIAEDEWVVTCYRMTGTHAGEWFGIRPTQKKISVYGINIDKVISGKIVEHTGAVNLLEGFLKIKAVIRNQD